MLCQATPGPLPTVLMAAVRREQHMLIYSMMYFAINRANHRSHVRKQTRPESHVSISGPLTNLPSGLLVSVRGINQIRRKFLVVSSGRRAGGAKSSTSRALEIEYHWAETSRTSCHCTEVGPCTYMYRSTSEREKKTCINIKISSNADLRRTC